MSNDINDYNFILPDELIAQLPTKKRSDARLLVVGKEESKIQDSSFSNIFKFLPKKTLFVFNNTKVVQARLIIENKEVFFLDQQSFIALVRPGKKFRLESVHKVDTYTLQVVDVLLDGRRVFKVFDLDMSIEDFFEKYGSTPLPPYIKTQDSNLFRNRYQTVYSKHLGSVAAPTAGLHFTQEMMDVIETEYSLLNVTLHVSLGTFKPIDVDSLEDHKMHSEALEYSQKTLDDLNRYKSEGYYLVAVGTTSLRFLQSLYNPQTKVFEAARKSTDIFIKPGFDDFCVEALITNFHLPKSSLFVLVSAFMGLEKMKQAYEFAIKNKFKFYSFGDSSLLMRKSGI